MRTLRADEIDKIRADKINTITCSSDTERNVQKKLRELQLSYQHVT